jgi:hypothetical protein
VRLFSVRQEFPSEWMKFLNQKLAGNDRAELSITLLAEHYPFWSRGRLHAVEGVDVFASSTKANLALKVYAVDDLWIAVTWRAA